MSRVIISVWLLACVCRISDGLSLTLTDLKRYVKDQDECWAYPPYGSGKPYLLGQKEEPLAQSMDNFISLIEKIEDHRSSRGVSADGIARSLLQRFRIDAISLNQLTGFFAQSPSARIQNSIEDMLLEDTMGALHAFDEESLEQAEKCSMFYMLSHFINNTATPDDSNTYKFRAPAQTAPRNGRFSPSAATSNANNGRLSAPAILTNHPREYGVVSLRNDQNQAIALNKILLAIIAAATGSESKSSSYILDGIMKDRQEYNNNAFDDQTGNGRQTGSQQRNLDALIGVTLAPTLAIASSEAEDTQMDKKFGASGVWNSTYCSTEYRLSEKEGTIGTLAEFRGGIDGYNLARLLRDNVDVQEVKRLKLSQILRLYYSPHGFRPLAENGHYCNRMSAVQRLDNELRTQTENYLRVFMPIVYKGQQLQDNQVAGFVDRLYSQFERYRKEALEIPSLDRDYCQSVDGIINDRSNQYPCETPRDVLFMLDSDRPREDMMNVIRDVQLKLDMRKYGSSMSILTNANGAFGSGSGAAPLQDIAWNTTNRGCALCKLAFTDAFRFSTPLKDADKIMERINGTLSQYESGQLSETAVPAKNFIIFNYDSIKMPTGSERDRFWQRKRELKWNHRDTPLLIVGSGSQKDQEMFTHDKEDVFLDDGADTQELSKRLNDRMCETAAAFQYPECAQQPSASQEIVGFVTPNTLQRWAFYPRYFLKSYHITFRVKVDSDQLEVCMSRQPKPEERSWECRETKEGEDLVLNSVGNPCNGRDLYSCDPIYFTFIGKRQGTSQRNLCRDDRCMNLEQIKFTLVHDGMSCNSASKPIIWNSLIVSWISLLFTAYTLMRKY